MKSLITFATLLALSPMALASHTYAGTRLQESTAVLADKEINDLLAVIQKNRRLTCVAMSTDDVVIKAGTNGDTDSFEADFGCNDANGGANVHRIDFAGSVSVSGGTFVFLESMKIEASE